MPKEPFPPDLEEFNNNENNFGIPPFTASPSGNNLKDDGFDTDDELASNALNFYLRRLHQAAKSLNQAPVKLWTGPGTFFFAGEQIIAPDDNFYSALVDHTSTAIFEDDVTNDKWKIFAGSEKDAFITVKPGGTAGLDADFLSIQAALDAGFKAIILKTGRQNMILSMTAAAGGADSTLTLQTSNHGYDPGDAILIEETSTGITTGQNADGPWIITATPTANTLTISVPAGGSITAITAALPKGRTTRILKETITLPKDLPINGTGGNDQIRIVGENRWSSVIWGESSGDGIINTAVLATDNDGDHFLTLQNLRFMQHGMTAPLIKIFTTGSGIILSDLNIIDCVFDGFRTGTNVNLEDSNQPVIDSNQDSLVPGVGQFRRIRVTGCFFGAVNATQFIVGGWDECSFIDNTWHRTINSPPIHAIDVKSATRSLIISGNHFGNISKLNMPPLVIGSGVLVAPEISSIMITDNMFSVNDGVGTHNCIQLKPGSATDCADIIISGNIFISGNAAIIIDDAPSAVIGCPNLVIGPNVTVGTLAYVTGRTPSSSMQEQLPVTSLVTNTDFPVNAAGNTHFIELDGTDTDTITEIAASAPSALANIPIPGTENFPNRCRAVMVVVDAGDSPGNSLGNFFELPNGIIHPFMQLTGGGAQAHTTQVAMVIIPVNNYSSNGQANLRLYIEDDDNVGELVRIIGYYLD